MDKTGGPHWTLIGTKRSRGNGWNGGTCMRGTSVADALLVHPQKQRERPPPFSCGRRDRAVTPMGGTRPSISTSRGPDLFPRTVQCECPLKSAPGSKGQRKRGRITESCRLEGRGPKQREPIFKTQFGSKTKTMKTSDDNLSGEWRSLSRSRNQAAFKQIRMGCPCKSKQPRNIS